MLGLLAAGALLDAIDLATFGPIGLWTGFLLGGATGWLLAPTIGIAPERRLWCAGLAGAYCMLPFTSFLPVGTLLAALASAWEPSPETPPVAAGERPAIEPEYHSHWDEDP